MLSTAVEVALEEESALLSARDKGLIAHRSESEPRASPSSDPRFRRPRYGAHVVAEYDSKRMIVMLVGAWVIMRASVGRVVMRGFRNREVHVRYRETGPGARPAASQGLEEYRRLQYM